MAEGETVEVLSRLPVPDPAVFRPSEKPTAKKKAQISTKPKKIASIRPVPSVISVSCSIVGMRLTQTSL